MAENPSGGGKRLAPDQNKGKKIAIAVACGVVALLAGAYVGLCAAASRGVMWPNTTVMGVDVSGLSVVQAEQAVREGLDRRWAGRSVTLRESASGVELSLPMEGLMEPEDLQGDLTRMLNGRAFLLRGAQYLTSLTGLDRVKLSPGLRYTPAGQARNQEVLEQLAEQVGMDKKETACTITDTQIIFRKGVTGTWVDTDAFHSGVYNALTGVGPEEIELVMKQVSPEEPDFEALRAKVLTEVSNAYLDKETHEIVPSVTGKDLDIGKAREKLAAAAEGTTCRVDLELTLPQPSTEELAGTLFRDVLGEATTRVTGTSDRRMNVGVAANFLNGVILFPGEEFSFNQVCSPYSVENGYGKATAYVNGLSKDTVAGGICQASSTLYWATLKANLTTVERYAHRYEPTYITGGLDATVYGNYGDQGSLDFRFTNSTEHPIKIEAAMDGKSNLHVKVYGTDTTGIHGEPYSAGRVVTQAYQTIYEANASVPQGTTKKDPERTGYNGVSLETYQKLVDKDGKTLETKLLYKTRYYVRNEVIFFYPDDVYLWNIDPYTGIKLETPVTPDPAESPAPEESPAVSGDPSGLVTPPEEGESQRPTVFQPPEATPAPVESYSPILPVEPEPTRAPEPAPDTPEPTPVPATPPPAPAPEPDPNVPLLPPGL